MLRCYKCKAMISPADPSVTWDDDQEDYVHRDCILLSTKIDKVKMHLLKGGRLTATDAVEYWKYHRLSSGIHKLIRRGIKISKEIMYDEKDKSKHWAVYFINKEQ